MKKLCIFLSIIMLFAFPVSVFAQTTPTETDVPSEYEEPITGTVSSVLFSIDNENVYRDMDKAYKDGYMPAVQNGKAILILPLIANGNITENSIKATPNLGDTSSSPFVFKNYQKTITLQNNPVNGTENTVSSYYVRFDLELSSQRINGTYPISVDISASDTNGNAITQTFTAYITITDGKDPLSEQTAPETQPEEKPTSQPIIIVSGHTVTPSPVQAGEEFAVDVTLLNTNESKSVQNMTVTVSSELQGLTLLNESNTFYFKKMSKNDTLTLNLKYKTGLDVIPGKYNINLAISYDNSDAATLSSSGSVPFEIVQPLRVELTVPAIAENVNAGDTLPLSFQIMNLGRSAIYNARCEVSGDGLLPSGAAFVGNMEAGTSATADVNVFIGSKDMTEGYSGSEKYGVTYGKIFLIYEDASGKEYKEEYEFTTTINEPVITASAEEPQEDTQSQWWISLVVLGVAAAGISAFIVIQNKRRKNDEG